MRKQLIFLCCSFWLLCQFSAFGRIKSNRENIFNLWRNKNKELVSIEKDLKQIEKKIVTKNSEYVALLKEKEIIESKLNVINGNIKQIIKKISSKEIVIKKSIVQLTLGQTYESAEGRLTSRAIKKFLQKKLNELKLAKNKLHKLQHKSSQLEERVQIDMGRESELFKIISGLEQNKLELAREYVDARKDASGLKNRLAKIKVRQLIHAKKVLKDANLIDLKFRPPLDNFTKLVSKKDGIQFEFTEMGPMLASRPGKILHAGEMSVYGNVVIIDHGNKVHSVLWGGLFSNDFQGNSSGRRGVTGIFKA